MVSDRDVIDAFVAYLCDHGHPGLRVDRRPDDENRGSPDIDAIAGAFAIEHTSVDTLSNQRRNSHWFMRAAGGLGQELATLPFRLEIQLDYHAVGRGQNWPAIRAALKTWITQEAPRLADGRHNIEDATGVPFRLNVNKASGRRPGVLFRVDAPDDTLSDRIQTSSTERRRSSQSIKNGAELPCFSSRMTTFNS